MKKTAIFIPSRLASTRLANKPLALIGNKPMILHVLDRAIEAGVGEVFVACADDEIALAVRNAGGNAIMTDEGHNSGSDRIAQALNIADPKGEIDLIINLQGDLPIIDPQILKLAPEIMKNQETDIGTFASAIQSKEELNNPNVVKVALSDISDQGIARAIYFSRSPIPYGAEKHWHHIGIYIYRRSSLEKFVSLNSSYLENCEKLEQLRALENGMRIDVAIVDTVPLGVDTLEDLEKVRAIYQNNSKS